MCMYMYLKVVVVVKKQFCCTGEGREGDCRDSIVVKLNVHIRVYTKPFQTLTLTMYIYAEHVIMCNEHTGTCICSLIPRLPSCVHVYTNIMSDDL